MGNAMGSFAASRQFSVVSFQSAVVSESQWRIAKALNFRLLIAEWGVYVAAECRFFFETIDFLMAARTAIRHGVMRVLKIGDVGARLYRWADAAPLAGGGFTRIIRKLTFCRLK